MSCYSLPFAFVLVFCPFLHGCCRDLPRIDQLKSGKYSDYLNCTEPDVEEEFVNTSTTTVSSTTATSATTTMTTVTTTTMGQLEKIASRVLVLINNPVFLEQFNLGLSEEIKDVVKIKKAEVQMTDSTELDLNIFKCDLEYDVSARLGQCQGLKTVQILNLVETENILTKGPDGELAANISVNLSLNSVTCSGHAHASGSACGIDLDLNANDASVTGSINHIIANMSGRMKKGTDDHEGKSCLEVETIVAEIQQNDIEWSNFSINFDWNSLYSIPDSTIDAIWESMPLEKVIEDLKHVVIVELKKEFDRMALCF